MKKRILSLVLCGALMFSLCFQSALAAGNGQTETECICASLCTTETIEEDCPVCGAENADFALCEGEAETAVYSIIGEGVPYLDVNGSQQSCNSYTVVDTTTTTWNEGWYVAEGDVTIPDSVTLTGNVHLILTDGCSLNVGGGIAGNEDSALTIYAQSTGDLMGNLTVTGGGQTEGVSAGIFVNGEFTLNGGNVISTGGTADNESNGIRTNAGIKISGGSITATGGSSEGISTGLYAEYGVEISGGTVTATGGEATGVQWTGSCGIFTYSGVEISGGIVTATGGSSEGISTGIRANACIKISGGTVTAIGDRAKYESIGIYTIYDKITITGGSVTAIGGSSENISMGIRNNSGVEISDGSVTATGGAATGGAVLSSGIYTMLEVNISGGSVTATGGVVTASGDSTQITSEGIVVIRGNITITGGSVTATGGAATGCKRATSHGIYVYGESEISACNITITDDAQVTATGGAAVAESCGIAAICIVIGVVPEDQGPVGSITITDNAQVIATGGTVTGGEMAFTCGFGASGGITVNGGHVVATGGTAPYSFGIYANGGIAINGGHIIAETKATSETHIALNAAPALPNTTYWWRTAETDTFTTSADRAYLYSDTHTYVEITDKEPTCVIFDPNGGVVNPTDAATDISGRLTSLPTPTRSGSYRFDGWYTAAEGGTMVTTETVFTEDATIYAHWSYKGGSGGGGGTTRCTVSFETNGGSKVSSQRITRNTSIKEPTAPTKDGYTFEGWYIDKELKTAYDFSTKVRKSFTLYAAWEEVDPTLEQIILVIGKKEAKVFGKTVANDVAPKIVNERTMLPSRFVAESLDAKVEWKETGINKGRVTITKDDIVIIINIGESVATVNGKEVKLDSPAFIENDRTYTPIRFISEELGAAVDWNEETQTVTITKDVK